MRAERYRCANCGKRFVKLLQSQYSCCVDHGSRECCHAFEREVTKKGWLK